MAGLASSLRGPPPIATTAALVSVIVTSSTITWPLIAARSQAAEPICLSPVIIKLVTR